MSRACDEGARAYTIRIFAHARTRRASAFGSQTCLPGSLPARIMRIPTCGGAGSRRRALKANGSSPSRACTHGMHVLSSSSSGPQPRSRRAPSPPSSARWYQPRRRTKHHVCAPRRARAARRARPGRGRQLAREHGPRHGGEEPDRAMSVAGARCANEYGEPRDEADAQRRARAEAVERASASAPAPRASRDGARGQRGRAHNPRNLPRERCGTKTASEPLHARARG